MKSKLIALIIIGVTIYSCSPKVAPQVTEIKQDLTPELAEGKSLYENNCANCHKLYSPSDFSKEDWKPIVASMQIKAKLNDAQGNSIYNYLISK
jgi:cytochrome c5